MNNEKRYKERLEKTLKALIKVAKSGTGRSPFIVADLVRQDDLFEVQDVLTQTIQDIAQELGNEEVLGLAKELPFVFEVEELRG